MNRKAFLQRTAVLPLAGAGASAWSQENTVAPRPDAYFKIMVVDDRTGRGVPLVELRTVNQIRFVTDSSGIVAFHEPGLMDREVFFHVTSHGYEFPADGFGFRGAQLKTTPGGGATLKITRINIAERLYQITGEGIYRDSVLVGEPVPIKEPLLNGQVIGQDSAQTIVYRGRIYWFWGDTARPSYPLGNFSTSGATSELPGKGGLDPAVGIALRYFVDNDGFSKKMAPLPDPGVVWIDGLMTVPDGSGRERLLARYERLKSLGEPLARGLLIWSDEKEVFEELDPLDRAHPLYPQDHPFRRDVNGTAYYYFPQPYPTVRVRATWDDIRNPTRYEAFTPLAPGARYQGAGTHLEQAANGRAVWAWKPDTAPLSPAQQRALVAAGKLTADESPFDLRDRDENKLVEAHGGSVFWNDFRKRWVMIVVQAGGTSFLGELWYAEAPAPEGPWRGAAKIVTHDRYTFYNPVQHPFLDQQNGRFVFFEGTYTNQFTGTPETPPTPRYDYNQVMYRLDLADNRLHAKTTP